HQVHALGVILNDLRQALIGALQIFGFLQQLRGVADCTERVADLVGDTGGQAAERGQFQLLRLLGDLRNVVEKNQDVLLVTALQGDETGLQHRSVDLRLQAVRSQGRVVQPLLQALHQFGAVRVDDLAGQFAAAQQLCRALVGQQHAMLCVEHQNAGTHALQDLFIELLQIGDVCRALLRQAFTQARSEEHTSELQSRENLVCRLLLEKKKYTS